MTALDPQVDSATVASVPSTPAPRATWRDYVSLIKPRIIELLLITTFPVMFLAERGVPRPLLVVATLVGGALSAACANVLNCYIDRDIDRLMKRTQNRPLVTGAISPPRALLFGVALGVLSIAILWRFVNPLSAALSFGAIVLYAWFYTIVLKRRTSQNIVWGGVAGCMPVLIGWTAVTNSLAWPPVVLFLVVFLWTPPHYWPLSMRFKDDYAAAGVPMLPVVSHNRTVSNHIVLYAWATVLTSLALIPIGPMGWVYTLAAVISGGAFIVEAHILRRRATNDDSQTLAQLKPMRLFHLSITYLTLLFVAVAVDPLLHFPLPWAS